MSILLIFLAFILLTIVFFEIEMSENINSLYFNLRISFLKSFIGISLISYIICEFLSLFNELSFNYVIISWALINLILIYIIKKNFTFQIIKINLFNIFCQKIQFNSADKIILYILLFLIILPLFILCIYIPPNNWDSMAYHLPRIEHWLQNKNIYPYPTNIVRQILSPPLSEYIIANFQILSNSDSFSNLVQFLSFILILSTVTLIFSIIKIGFKGQLFLALAILCIPMMLFQATTTQTDLLASFFFLSFILFSLLIILKKNNFKSNFTFLALSITLGFLTKYHIAIFTSPIVLYILFEIIRRRQNKNLIFVVIVSIITVIIILVPLFARNIYFFGSITGKDIFDNNATIVNSSINFKNMLSNNLKHIVDFISIPINSYNNFLFTVNHNLHNLIGISENNPSNNWAGEKFIVNNHLNEDTAGSLLHAILIIISILLVFKSKYKTKLFFLFSYCFISLSLYGLFFRYTPFDLRLLLPVLIFLVIISTYILYTSISNKFIIYSLTLLFLLLSIFPVYFNRAKPIIANPFNLKRIITNSPKGEIDKSFFALIPESRKNEIINNYILLDSNYILKENLSKEQQKNLFKLEDSLGLFDFDKKTIFQKTRLDNYFTQNAIIQKNIDTLFNNIALKKISNISYNKLLYIDLKTEFDSYEYLIWLYVKENFKNNFYIGNSDKLKYLPYSKNNISSKFYNIEIIDKNKNWTIKYKN